MDEQQFGQNNQPAQGVEQVPYQAPTGAPAGQPGVFSAPPQAQGKHHTAALILGIVSIVVGLLIPIGGIICGALAIVFCVKNTEIFPSKLPMILGIIGIVIAIINWIAGALLIAQMLG